MSNIPSSAFADTKPHYEILDGLRGVAALMVVFYHVFEGFAIDLFHESFYHGYMAVDFFFILSGFVIGYAYDDRWPKLTKRQFFRRRLIRLHPMVIMGAIIGAISFLVHGSVNWNHEHIATSLVMFALLFNLFLIPLTPQSFCDVRGNGELFPLNGPSWSLFFEYVGNILYALFIHRLSTKALRNLVLLFAVLLVLMAVGNLSGAGHIGMGWTMAGTNLYGGFVRMMFSYTMGMYIARQFNPIPLRGGFWICSIILFLLFLVPHVGGQSSPWLNGIYDSVCVIFIFPLLIRITASQRKPTALQSSLYNFLGNLSYPLYMIHYPLMYLYFAYIWDNNLTFAESWHIALLVVVSSIVLALIIQKVYDEPIRRYLSRRKG